MSLAIYDNPHTMSRELWKTVDGVPVLKAFTTSEFIQASSRTKRNLGDIVDIVLHPETPWESGFLLGDVKCIPENQRPTGG